MVIGKMIQLPTYYMGVKLVGHVWNPMKVKWSLKEKLRKRGKMVFFYEQKETQK